jgi:hypothetical protein
MNSRQNVSPEFCPEIIWIPNRENWVETNSIGRLEKLICPYLKHFPSLYFTPSFVALFTKIRSGFILSQITAVHTPHPCI